jgi:hypothetical protein
VIAQRLQRGAELRGGGEGLDELVGAPLVDDPRLLPLFGHRVFDVAQGEDEGLLLAGGERDLQAV